MKMGKTEKKLEITQQQSRSRCHSLSLFFGATNRILDPCPHGQLCRPWPKNVSCLRSLIQVELLHQHLGSIAIKQLSELLDADSS